MSARPGASQPVLAAPREIDALPGPRGLPLLGVALEIDKPHFHAQVERWAREHGTVFVFRMLRLPVLCIADAEALAAMLRDRPAGFRRTPKLAQISRELGLAPGVFGAEGDAWQRQRRMVMAGFDPRHLKAYFPKLAVTAERLRGRWQHAADAGLAIDLQRDLMRFTVDAISGLAFGADIDTLRSDDDIIQRHLDKIFPALFRRLLAPLPTWRWWKSAEDRAVDRGVVEVNRAIAGFVAAARERLRDPARRAAPPNLLEAMIVAADDEGSGITDAEVSGNVMTMLLAGEDTTAHTLAWMTWLLHRHPEALARARAEVDALGVDPAGWTPERFARLPWLDACCNETMRLKPVAPTITLQALRDTVVAGVRVPSGTIVWGAMRSPNLDARHFDDAAAFRPARWLAGDASGGALSANRVAMPFGAGPRVCPGRHLALLEMKIALAVLLGSFEIAELRTASGGEPDERLSFTMAPEPLTMRLARRAPAAAPVAAAA